MCLLNPAHDDIRHARDCAIVALMDTESPVWLTASVREQQYLADLVRIEHDRNRQIEAARTLSRPGRRGRTRAANVIDLPRQKVA